MSAEVLLLILAGFVLYPLFVGVSYRFLGRRDRLGLFAWCVRYVRHYCPEHKALLDWEGDCPKNTDGPKYHHVGRTRAIAKEFLDTEKAWAISAVWPLTWTFILVCYLAYYAIWTPIKLLALATAKTAQLTSGEKDNA